MELSRQLKGKPVLLGVAAVVALGGVAIWFFTRDDSDLVRVPLGVEQAAIVTYGGPELMVAPYKWGVAVNVRIANVAEQPDRRIYDLRYIVNREGTFDLKDYLAATDGSALTGLPTFRFTGDPMLSKNLDTRIQETEEIRVDVGGRYYETMAGLAALWIAWLFLLLFYKRPRPLAESDVAPPEPTPAETLRGFLVRLEAGTLDGSDKARLEMIMLRCWRDELALDDPTMADVIGSLSRHEKTREPLRKLQDWLHRPASAVSDADIAAVLRPYTLDPAP